MREENPNYDEEKDIVMQIIGLGTMAVATYTYFTGSKIDAIWLLAFAGILIQTTSLDK